MLNNQEIDTYNAMLDICSKQDGTTMAELEAKTKIDRIQLTQTVHQIIYKGLATSIFVEKAKSVYYPIANGEKFSNGLNNYSEHEINEKLKLRKCH
ncbi:hypothetical protein [Vibrio owensii]|uniref:hypothetical protein n=1 Tax=Vibrio owensii TaxID=696485 RepID=UPI0018F27167|nr:hypothetical protein [Vibrio owensii]